METFKSTAQFVDNPYSVDFLWYENKLTSTYKKSLVLGRFHSLEKKFKHHAEFVDKYKKTINTCIDKAHAVILSLEEVHFSVKKYVPHRGVTNVNKPGKVKIVFDAAAQFDKTCLNEKLLKGPDYLNKLIGILLRFRREPYAVISDI